MMYSSKFGIIAVNYEAISSIDEMPKMIEVTVGISRRRGGKLYMKDFGTIMIPTEFVTDADNWFHVAESPPEDEDHMHNYIWDHLDEIKLKLS